MSMRTPLGRVRGHGSAKSGTGHFIHQRLTAIGKRLATMYPPERPRSFAIVGEVEQLVTAPSDRVGNWLDRESVKRVEHQPGYNVGYLDRARAAFTRARGVPGEWDR